MYFGAPLSSSPTPRMTFDTLRTYCLAKPGTTEDCPFGPDVLVFRVMGKMFALTNIEKLTVNLKCDPERALELRATYEAVRPGYHMNKTHWNTVDIRSDLPGDEVRDLIDHSYDLVAASLKRADREALAALGSGLD
ncbi:MAG: MmcQ/YjbR family DNA-binding protein [Rhodothermales bacterium]